jgi:hypothetical protein
MQKREESWSRALPQSVLFLCFLRCRIALGAGSPLQFLLVVAYRPKPPSSLPLVQGMPASTSGHHPIPGRRGHPPSTARAAILRPSQSVYYDAITCVFFLSPDAYRPCNTADDCRVRLRQHCEPAVPRAVAFGSSQCGPLWARPRALTRLIRRPQNACVADLSLDMTRRYTRAVPMISRGSRIACCCSGHQRVRHLGQDLLVLIGADELPCLMDVPGAFII